MPLLPRPTKHIPALQPLEPRRLLSIAIKGVDAILIGTEANDVITISVSRDRPTHYRVSVNGEVARIRANAIKRFRIAALGGDDFVGVDPSYGVVGDARLIDLDVGNDTLSSSAGEDRASGGGGHDLILTGSGNDRAGGGAGRDTIGGGNGNDVLDGGEDDDSIVGSNGDDVLVGGIDDDAIAAGAGNDIAFGDAGNDTISGFTGDDQLDGGDGADNLQGDDDDDNLFGGAGADTLAGANGDDVLAGDVEGSLQFAGDTPVPIPPLATIGDDSMSGGAGADTLLGFTGADILVGGSDEDVLDGRGAGADIRDATVDDVQPSAAAFAGTPFTSILATIRVRVQDARGRVRDVVLPVGTGSFPDATSPAEVVNENGLVQFASNIPKTAFLLGEFFQAAGIPFGETRLGRFSGRPVTVRVNNIAVTTVGDTILPPNSVIDVAYGDTVSGGGGPFG